MSKDPKPDSVSLPTPQDFREMDFYAWELMETFPSETAEELMERMIYSPPHGIEPGRKNAATTDRPSATNNL